ncbi:unnamed protein product [Psylliodes chrysocephalus]|uniref:Uncharacterized protein n=1 Tax=Psylliodes chrysocephalus TaxID=3402493 RepID=A0A9P0CRY7_9CUCU|nr:unnamed protein product [Psylliodes chrysocephala]
MTQRQIKTAPHGLHLDSLVCEKYMNKIANREKQINQILSATARGREKIKSPINEHRDIKPRPNVRQQNVSPTLTKNAKRNVMQYADDSALVEGSVKPSNRQRSKSTADRECWSQMLKEHKGGDKFSVFGSFDPLRTLHFLSKELQLQLHTILPDDDKVQGIVSDMQYALKRVPPEIASQVHLLQGLEILQGKGKLPIGKHIREEIETLDCGVQTVNIKTFENSEKLQKKMAEGTLKLESSCRQMEKICTDLKKEKNELEDELDEAKDEIELLKKKISKLEHENNEVLNPRINSLEGENRALNNQLKTLSSNSNNQFEHTVNNLKSQIAELRCQKNASEQENNKLKHQIKVGALEREKFIAVLTLRDTQINEIRTEMSQLQELVNEQLMEVHSNAFEGAPNAECTGSNCPDGKPDDKMGKNLFAEDNTLSTILTNEDFARGPRNNMSSNSFKELQSGEIDMPNIPDLENMIKSLHTQDQKVQDQIAALEKLDSHSSIKTMFDEIKKTAYAVAKSQRSNKYS